jgi:hypothetical protein
MGRAGKEIGMILRGCGKQRNIGKERAGMKRNIQYEYGRRNGRGYRI